MLVIGQTLSHSKQTNLIFFYFEVSCGCERQHSTCVTAQWWTTIHCNCGVSTFKLWPKPDKSNAKTSFLNEERLQCCQNCRYCSISLFSSKEAQSYSFYFVLLCCFLGQFAAVTVCFSHNEKEADWVINAKTRWNIPDWSLKSRILERSSSITRLADKRILFLTSSSVMLPYLMYYKHGVIKWLTSEPCVSGNSIAWLQMTSPALHGSSLSNMLSHFWPLRRENTTFMGFFFLVRRYDFIHKDVSLQLFLDKDVSLQLFLALKSEMSWFERLSS